MRTKSQSGRDLKNNDNKHPQKHDDWMEAKKVGRPKQVWVWDVKPGLYFGEGHWEKLDTTT